MSAVEQPRMLITGPAGTGKTTYCIQRFAEVMDEIHLREPDAEAYYILPSKEHADRIQTMLLRQTQSDGFCGNRILTLSDLIRLKATRKAGRLISGMERAWMVSSILNSNHWLWWESCKSRPGLISAASDWLAEMRSSGVQAADVRERLRASGLNPRRKRKYQDLSKLLQLYEDRILHDGLFDSEELMLNFIQEHSEGNLPRNVELLIVDGFYRFTGLQKMFLNAFSGSVKQTIITLTHDHQSQSDVFRLPNQTRSYFLGSGFSERILERQDNLRFGSSGLSAFERCLATSTFTDKNASEGMSCIEVESQINELDYISDIILESVKKQQSYFSDHMVIVRNISAYKNIFENSFMRKKIPFFIHERKKLIDDPTIRFMADWHALLKYENETWMLNTRLFELVCSRRESIDPQIVQKIGDVILEMPEYEKAETVFIAMDSFEHAWISHLIHTLQFRIQAETGADLNRLILSDLLNLFHGEGEYALPNTSVENFLKQFTQEHSIKIARHRISFEEALLRLMSDLESGLYSEKPKNKNLVQIYDVVLSLPKEYKHVYVLGLSDGIFPPDNTENAVFDDTDRRLIFPNDEVLSSKEYWYGEQFFFYMAVSRATQRLTLTRPQRDESEKSLIPSIFFEQALSFTQPKAVSPVSDGNSVLFNLSLAIRQKNLSHAQRCMGLLNLLDRHWIEKAQNILMKSLPYQEGVDSAGELACKRMTDTARSFSPTELSTLNDCSYKHYVEYILGIRSEDSNIYLEEGNFLHQCMETWVKEKCFKLTLEESKQRANEIFDGHLSELKITFKSHYEKNESTRKLRRWVLETMAAEHQKIMNRGDCEPIGAEIAFGKKYGNEVILNDSGDQIHLHGKIDRVDCSSSGRYTVVVDYKRGKVPSRAELVKGRNPQTPVYLLAGSALSEYPAIGMEYVSFSKPKHYQFIHPDYAGRLMHAKGEKDYGSILAEAQQAIVSDVKRLRTATVRALPMHEHACQNCSHTGSCRFKNWKYYQ